MTVVLSLGLFFGFMFLLALPIALLAAVNRPGVDEEFNPSEPEQRRVSPVVQLPRILPERDFEARIRAVVAEQSKTAPSEEQVARLMQPTPYYCYEFQPLHVARITMHDIAALQQRPSK